MVFAAESLEEMTRCWKSQQDYSASRASAGTMGMPNCGAEDRGLQSCVHVIRKKALAGPPAVINYRLS